MRRLPFLARKAVVPLAALCVYAALALVVDLRFVDRFPDGDQAVVADMARWFADGAVREPYFFGQAYLFPLGSYLAVPLVWTGVDPFRANELITAVCLFGPFLVVGTILYLRRGVLLALLCFSVPLLFPPTLLIAALQPRGLIEPIGIAATLIGLVCCGFFRGHWARFAVFASVGLCFGSVLTGIVLLPIAVAAALLGRTRVRAVVLPPVAFGAGFAVIQGLALFYRLRPAFVVFPRDQDFTLSMEQLLSNLRDPAIQQAALRIAFVVAIPVAVLGVLASLGLVRIFARGRRDRIVALLGVVATLSTFVAVLASTKVADSMDTVYFTADRLLIGFVFLPLCFLPWFERAAQEWRPRLVVPLATSAVILVLGLTAMDLTRGFGADGPMTARVSSFRPVAVVERSTLVDGCEELAAIRLPGHYLVLTGVRADPLVYGCHALEGVDVVQDAYERRSWAVGVWQREGLVAQVIDATTLAHVGYSELPFDPRR